MSLIIHLLILLLFNQVRCDNKKNCSLNTLTALWYKDIDSEPLNFTLSQRIELSDEVFRGKIQLFEDAFQFSIHNQSVNKLCENSVKITNDLTVLKLINVSLYEMEAGAFNVVSTLAIIKISYNPLNVLRNGVFRGVKVKELDLSHNFISTIESEALDNIANLEVVRLSYNAIKEMNPDWFDNCPKLFKLNIMYNELTRIPSNAFKNFAKNRPLKLRFSANQITEIHRDAFNETNDIEMLRLNGNKIKEIPNSLFDGRIVKNLQVNTNKLQCFPHNLFESKGLRSIAFIENMTFNCTCLNKVRSFVEKNNVDVWYPSIICEDRAKEVNIVFNYNKTYEIPVLLPSTEVALLLPFNGAT